MLIPGYLYIIPYTDVGILDLHCILCLDIVTYYEPLHSASRCLVTIETWATISSQHFIVIDLHDEHSWV